MAGSTVIGALRVNLSADTAAFGNGLKNAQRQMGSFSKQVSIASRGIAAAMGPVLGAITFAGLISGAKRAADEFDRLGKAARTAGLSTDTFQVLRFAALEEGVSGLDTALQSFTVRTGQAAQGQGELAAVLARINPEILKQIQVMTSQEAKLRILADAVQNATSAEEKALISRAAFGRSGVEMVRIMNAGSAGLDRFAARARAMGLIVDKQLIEKSEELANKLGVAGAVIDVELKQALIRVVPIIVAAARAVSAVASAVNDVIEGVVALQNRSSDKLMRDAAAIKKLIEMNPEGMGFVGIEQMQADLDAMMAELRKRAHDELRVKLFALGSTKPELDDILSDLDEIFARLQKVSDQPSALEKGLGGVTTSLDTMADTMSRIGGTIEASFGRAFDSLVEGTFKVKDALADLAKDMARLAANVIFQSLMTNLFAGSGGNAAVPLPRMKPVRLPEMARGGNFMVGGAGAIDSQLVAFKATPGELVDVRRPGDRGGAGGTVVNVNVLEGKGTRTETSRDEDGAINIETFVDDIVARKIDQRGSASNRALGTRGRTIAR